MSVDVATFMGLGLEMRILLLATGAFRVWYVWR